MSELSEERTKICLIEDEDVATPILEWNFKFNDQTKKEELDLVQLSDGSKFNTENLRKALKKPQELRISIQVKEFLEKQLKDFLQKRLIIVSMKHPACFQHWNLRIQLKLCYLVNFLL
jgi:hypothetical protein